MPLCKAVVLSALRWACEDEDKSYRVYLLHRRIELSPRSLVAYCNYGLLLCICKSFAVRAGTMHLTLFDPFYTVGGGC